MCRLMHGMRYALESGCCNSPDAALITTATQYCKMNEAYSRAYPSAIIPGPLLHKTHLKRSMVPRNDLGVPCCSWATEQLMFKTINNLANLRDLYATISN